MPPWSVAFSESFMLRSIRSIDSPTIGTPLMISPACCLMPRYQGFVRMTSRYSANAPTRGQIDILLSLRMISRRFLRNPALLSASKTMPEGSAPSPITATERRSSRPQRPSPLASPRAVDTLDPACPVMNRSYGLSSGFG